MNAEIFGGTNLESVKVFVLLALSFAVAIFWTPVLTSILYAKKAWKKTPRNVGPDGRSTPEFRKLHATREVSTPRMGGLLIWGTVLGVAVLLFFLSAVTDNALLSKLNFLSRNQTWLPLFTLVAAALVGLADDLFVVKGKGGYQGGGMRFSVRIFYVLLIGLIGALWFHYKLGWDSIHIPAFGDVTIGAWYIPLFMIVMLGTFSGGVVDGLDGLSGGVFATIFSAYAGIAFVRGQIDLAAFCAVIVGATLAYLWFNIPPARFYMGETGILGLTTTLTVVAFLTNSVVVLPIVGFVLVLESASVIIQLTSKALRGGKKVFLIAPLHHHFEAVGWPAEKVTMRFWVISAVMATVGFVIAIIGSGA
ncbi:MAG: hypothetical protein HYZ08_03100 [Candidatus Kerfeldbacteria bacterium]|nr:hypothetical protein [Candidatus Kerfeldbacteria bacterium]